jgi:hypothetical protein
MKEIELGYISLEKWKSTNGLVPSWARERGEEELDRNEIVLEGSKDYTLTIDYPLSTPALFPLRTPSTGVSRIDLVEIIVKAYREVYKEEEESTKVKSGLIPGMYNRNTTDGKYGIWGHGLGDLMLHAAYVDEETGVIELGVDS